MSEWYQQRKRGEEYLVNTWTYERDFTEQALRKSKATVDERGVFELYFNFRTPAPINAVQSRQAISRKLKRLLGITMFICCVSPSQSVKGGGYFCSNVQFYCRMRSLPRPEIMEAIPNVVEANYVPALYKKTLKNGDVEFYEYSELPDNYSLKRHIISECEGKVLRKSKSGRICKGTWEFAD